MALSVRTRFIIRTASAYAVLYLLGTIGLHLLRVSRQGKALTTGLAEYLSFDVIAAVLSGWFVAWYAWRRMEKQRTRISRV